ncbi:hypothetical protein AGMMS49545_13350 [Betaproteobacteria bacterium]|nr:hypothetical protein AGMMS49545_13350 [Betaproteobacteria bacterium]GHU39806.1 hypothetical protein AGMMS50289_00170 [Betaproteobacteria bacterium]
MLIFKTASQTHINLFAIGNDLRDPDTQTVMTVLFITTGRYIRILREDLLNDLFQIGLIPFDSQQIVGFSFADDFRDLALAAWCVQTDQATPYF